MWRNRLFVLLVIIASASFASCYGGPIPYSLFYFSLALPLVAWLYILYVYTHFKIYQRVEAKTLVKGEPTAYAFELCNEDVVTFQSIRLLFFDKQSKLLNFQEDTAYCLLPGDAKGATSTLICHYLGEYEVGIDAVQITDFLHLFCITYPLPTHLKVTVLPRLIPLTTSQLITLDADTKQGLYKTNTSGEERDAQVEKYSYGSSLKTIHWKASAKKQELMMRTLAPITRKNVCLYLDLISLEEDDETKLHLQDQMIECLLALAYYAMGQALPTCIYFAQRTILQEPITSSIDFTAFYEKCSHLSFTSAHSLEEVLHASAYQLYENHQYILITHTLTHALYKALIPIKDRDNAVTVIYAKSSPTEEDATLIAALMTASVQVLCLTPDTIPEEVL